MKSKFLTSSIFILLLNSLIFGQTTDSIQICQQVIKFDSTCTVNQSFQSVKSEEFDMMWLYLITNPSSVGTSISKDKSGDINYTSSYSLDHIIKNGFSIYPNKKYVVIHTPITLKVLNVEMNGYKIELKGKKKSLFYLVFGGELNGKNIGFQIKMNKDVESNNDFPLVLKNVIKIL